MPKKVEVNHAMAFEGPSIHVPADQLHIRAILLVTMRDPIQFLVTGISEPLISVSVSFS